MRNPSSLLRRALPLSAAALVAVVGVTAVAVAAGRRDELEGRQGQGQVPGPGARRAEKGDLPPLRQAARRTPRSTGPERSQRAPRATKARRATRRQRRHRCRRSLRLRGRQPDLQRSLHRKQRRPRAASAKSRRLTCPAGKRVIGGGTDLGTNATQNGQQRQVTVSFSGPNGTGTAWSAQLFNNSTVASTPRSTSSSTQSAPKVS